MSNTAKLKLTRTFTVKIDGAEYWVEGYSRGGVAFMCGVNVSDVKAGGDKTLPHVSKHPNYYYGNLR